MTTTVFRASPGTMKRKTFAGYMTMVSFGMPFLVVLVANNVRVRRILLEIYGTSASINL